MRKLFGAGILLLAAMLIGNLLFRPVTTVADEAKEEPRTISVVGQGTIAASYDTAIVTIGVRHTRDTALEAYNAMAEDMNKLVSNLKAQGIQEDQLQTGTFYLNPEYDWIQDKGQVLRGYTASNTLQVKTHDLENVAELVQKAVNAGANQIQGITFTIENQETLLHQALDRAVDDAEAKAARVAQRLGAKVGAVRHITVQDNSYSIMPAKMFEARLAMDAAVPAPVYSGTTEFTAAVSVVFELN